MTRQTTRALEDQWVTSVAGLVGMDCSVEAEAEAEASKHRTIRTTSEKFGLRQTLDI